MSAPAPSPVSAPTVEIFGADDVPASVTWQAVTLMRCAWPELFDGGLRWLDRPFEQDVDPRYLVLRELEVLLAHAVVLQVPDDEHEVGLRVAGLACVLTSPPHRGAGLATTVLREADRLLDDGDADVAALFCEPHLEGFYARLGWVACPGATLVGEAGEPCEDLRMMRFLTDAGRAAEDRLRTEPMRVAWTW